MGHLCACKYGGLLVTNDCSNGIKILLTYKKVLPEDVHIYFPNVMSNAEPSLGTISQKTACTHIYRHNWKYNYGSRHLNKLSKLKMMSCYIFDKNKVLYSAT